MSIMKVFVPNMPWTFNILSQMQILIPTQWVAPPTISVRKIRHSASTYWIHNFLYPHRILRLRQLIWLVHSELYIRFSLLAISPPAYLRLFAMLSVISTSLLPILLCKICKVGLKEGCSSAFYFILFVCLSG